MCSKGGWKVCREREQVEGLLTAGQTDVSGRAIGELTDRCDSGDEQVLPSCGKVMSNVRM